jgi:hypothetical protein
MTGRILLLRAVAAVAAGLACQVVHAELPSPILAMATGQMLDAGPSISKDGVLERHAPEAGDSSLSLIPESPLTFPPELMLGEGPEISPHSRTSTYNPLQLGPDPYFTARENFITSPPSIFDAVGDYFDGENIEWPLGTQQSVFIVPTPVRGNNKLIPFIDLLQDGDERNMDAHLRMGAGVGLKYLLNSDMSIDTEVMALDGAGDHNPANSSETRFMVLFTVRF